MFSLLLGREGGRRGGGERERERESGKDGEREISTGCILYAPRPGIEPIT